MGYRMEDVRRFNSQPWWTPYAGMAGTIAVAGAVVEVLNWLLGG